VPWAASSAVWAQGERRDSAPLPHSGETPRESCVQLWSPQHRTELELLEWGQRRLEPLCWEDRLRELGLFSLEKRRLRIELRAAASAWRGPIGKMGKIFSAGIVEIGQGAMALN